jgi:hypothetical protein
LTQADDFADVFCNEPRLAVFFDYADFRTVKVEGLQVHLIAPFWGLSVVERLTSLNQFVFLTGHHFCNRLFTAIRKIGMVRVERSFLPSDHHIMTDDHNLETFLLRHVSPSLLFEPMHLGEVDFPMN